MMRCHLPGFFKWLSHHRYTTVDSFEILLVYCVGQAFRYNKSFCSIPTNISAEQSFAPAACLNWVEQEMKILHCSASSFSDYLQTNKGNLLIIN